MNALATGIAMGIGGTLAMDVWAQVLHRFAGQSLPNWAMPGRWFGHAMRGRIWHDDIQTAAAVPNELALGWVLHYGVGIIYGAAFAVAAGPAWLATPSFLPVWIYAIVTIAAGWFLLQPGMGLGWAAAKTPAPWTARGMGLVAHTIFGLGMWAVALIL